MSKKAFVFPGQGSQYVGMGQDLYTHFPEAKIIFDQAHEILGRDIAALCFQGPEEDLKKTENTQAGIFLTSVCLARFLAKKGYQPDFVAGHSLGEVTACYIAGAFDLVNALKIIKARGEFMAASFASDRSAMAAVLGMDSAKLKEVLTPYEHYPVVIANYNSPSQIVISGEKEGVRVASEALKEQGAKRVIPLPVSGAFHSPLMSSAASKFARYLEDIPFEDSKIPIILNRTAQPETKAQKLKENLSLQIKSPVFWVDSLHYLKNKVDFFIECGPGKVLTGLIKKTLPDTQIYSVSTLEDAQKLD